MSKTKSITELVQDLQQENESLKNLCKLANQYTKMEFGYSVTELHEIIKKFHIYEKKMKAQAQANALQKPPSNSPQAHSTATQPHH